MSLILLFQTLLHYKLFFPIALNLWGLMYSVLPKQENVNTWSCHHWWTHRLQNLKLCSITQQPYIECSCSQVLQQTSILNCVLLKKWGSYECLVSTLSPFCQCWTNMTKDEVAIIFISYKSTAVKGDSLMLLVRQKQISALAYCILFM